MARGELGDAGNHFEIDNQLREHDAVDEKVALEAPDIQEHVEVLGNDINENNSFAGLEPPDTAVEAVPDQKQSENVVREPEDVTKSSKQYAVLPLAAGPIEVSPSPEQSAADVQNDSADELKKTYRKIGGKKVAVRFDSDGDSIYDDSEEEAKPAKGCKKKGQLATKKVVHEKKKTLELPLNNADLIDPLNEASSDDDDESSSFFSDDGVPVINIPLASILKQKGFQLRRISESEYSEESKKEVVQNFEGDSST